MPYEPDPYNTAELLQALDDVHEAARRVDHERTGADESREPVGGASAPHQLAPTDDKLAG
jgi:hypothetical protein